MITVDARGKLCPQPLILTKRALKQAEENAEITILCDNDVAFQNLQDYLRELHYPFLPTWQNGQGSIVLKKSHNESISEVAAEDFCRVLPPTGTHVVVLRSEVMGQGDDTLGAMLLRSFVNSLIETDVLPSAILLYNTGVKLALRDTDTAISLTNLAEKGVAIYLCGACVDFFDIKKDLGVGTITNMFKITDMVSRASHVIYP